MDAKYLRRKLKGMTEEQKLLQIKEIALEREMREIRYRVLKSYRDRNWDNSGPAE
jgi:hypothetical protein